MESFPKKANEKYIKNLYDGNNYIDLKIPIKPMNKNKRIDESIINEKSKGQHISQDYLISRGDINLNNISNFISTNLRKSNPKDRVSNIRNHSIHYFKNNNSNIKNNRFEFCNKKMEKNEENSNLDESKSNFNLFNHDDNENSLEGNNTLRSSKSLEKLNISINNNFSNHIYKLKNKEQNLKRNESFISKESDNFILIKNDIEIFKSKYEELLKDFNKLKDDKNKILDENNMLKKEKENKYGKIRNVKGHKQIIMDEKNIILSFDEYNQIIEENNKLKEETENLKILNKLNHGDSYLLSYGYLQLLEENNKLKEDINKMEISRKINKNFMEKNDSNKDNDLKEENMKIKSELINNNNNCN